VQAWISLFTITTTQVLGGPIQNHSVGRLDCFLEDKAAEA
jgi:hypothetical protein